MCERWLVSGEALRVPGEPAADCCMLLPRGGVLWKGLGPRSLVVVFLRKSRSVMALRPLCVAHRHPAFQRRGNCLFSAIRDRSVTCAGVGPCA